MPNTNLRTCARAGCPFPRLYEDSGGRRRRREYCGTTCYVWSARAHRAAASAGPAAERDAAELLRLAVLMDARRTATEEVPGVFDNRPASRM